MRIFMYDTVTIGGTLYRLGSEYEVCEDVLHEIPCMAYEIMDEINAEDSERDAAFDAYIDLCFDADLNDSE